MSTREPDFIDNMFSRADDELTRLRKSEVELKRLRTLGARARAALDHPDNRYSITDTIWAGPGETLADLLDDIAGESKG